jgi:hypothetical protein
MASDTDFTQNSDNTEIIKNVLVKGLVIITRPGIRIKKYHD